ncbi:DMT family transporter [Sphaerisporangium sp. NPDC051017]|uniref:DMT family transporter n=1 Tax=Sphaerisporangium sp. NPDC051017 TaxID=3154636 RepID=UPI0034380DD3
MRPADTPYTTGDGAPAPAIPSPVSPDDPTPPPHRDAPRPDARRSVRTRHLAGVAALLGVTAVWGSTFPLTKDMVTRLPVIDMLAARYLISVAILLALRPRALRGIGPGAWRAGVALGLVYGAALVTQTYGLKALPSSVSGFVTGSYVVMTPLLALLWFRTPITARTWTAVGLAVAGLGAITLMSGDAGGGSVSGAGLALTLGSAALYAVHVVALGRWSRPEHAYALAVLQVGTMALVCTAVAAPGGIALPATPGDWAGLVYLATAAGALSFLAQTWAQAHVPATPAAVVMSIEPLWATAFATLLYGEAAGWSLLVGGTCLLTAMVLVAVPARARRAALPAVIIVEESGR